MLEVLVNIIQVIFFAVMFSYYLLLFKRQPKLDRIKDFRSLTIIIPARNEERYIADSIQSAIDAEFKGKKEIIVVDDSSTDRTSAIAGKFPVRLMRNKSHSGKSQSLNNALAKAKGELVAVIDADSIIEKKALVHAMPYFNSGAYSAVTSTVKVKNRSTLLGLFLHIEQLYNSLLRSFFVKMNANITTPGPLSIYVKKDLQEIGGFSVKGYSEDVDVAIRLIRNGKHIAVSEKSVSETNMPVSARGFIKQRTRFARGWIHVLKQHFGKGSAMIDYYSLPLAVFWFIQAAIMSVSVLIQIISSYNQYFLAQGQIFNLHVLNFLLGWLSLLGTVNWIISIFTGQIPLTTLTFFSLASTLLSYPLYLLAILRYDKSLKLSHILPFCFMFPYWFAIMLIYIINIPELFLNIRRNIWEKVV